MTRGRFSWLVFILSAIMLAGCGSVESDNREIFAMDTVISIEAYGDNAKTAVDEAVSEINRIDALFSTENEKSEIYKINSSGTATLDAEAADLISKALDFGKKTEGAFDISLYPVVDSYGFFTKEYKVPSDEEIESLLKSCGSDMVEVDGNKVSLGVGTKIDLGGIAKGYAGGKVAETLKNAGVESALVNLGGNVVAIGSKMDGGKWSIAVRDPKEKETFACVVSVSDASVVTSGAYERFFEKDGVTYHHIIDPATGRPARSGIESATIISKDATLADAYSTSMFVMGKDAAIEFWRKSSDEFDMILISDDGTMTITEGIENDFKSDKDFEVVRK